MLLLGIKHKAYIFNKFMGIDYANHKNSMQLHTHRVCCQLNLLIIV